MFDARWQLFSPRFQLGKDFLRNGRNTSPNIIFWHYNLVGTKGGPQKHWWILWTMIFYNIKKFTWNFQMKDQTLFS